MAFSLGMFAPDIPGGSVDMSQAMSIVPLPNPSKSPVCMSKEPVAQISVGAERVKSGLYGFVSFGVEILAVPDTSFAYSSVDCNSVIPFPLANVRLSPNWSVTPDPRDTTITSATNMHSGSKT